MDIKEIEKVVSSIQTAVFRKANHQSAGALRSRFKGAGLQFRDHQIYTHGDDVRFIDWKVSARTSHTYVKTFEEDRNVEICVFLDITPTMFYGSHGKTKLQAALEITALLYLLAQETHDQIRTVLIMNGEFVELPPKRGREGLVQFISQLEKKGLLTEEGKIALGAGRAMRAVDGKLICSQIKRHVSRRRECIYLGDMGDWQEGQELRQLSQDARFHGVRILSPLDLRPLSFSFSLSPGRFAGLSSPQSPQALLARFPVISTEERYLEVFLRRLP